MKRKKERKKEENKEWAEGMKQVEEGHSSRIPPRQTVKRTQSQTNKWRLYEVTAPSKRLRQCPDDISQEEEWK